jgi:hypothetical protein
VLGIQCWRYSAAIGATLSFRCSCISHIDGVTALMKQLALGVDITAPFYHIHFHVKLYPRNSEALSISSLSTAARINYAGALWQDRA